VRSPFLADQGRVIARWAELRCEPGLIHPRLGDLAAPGAVTPLPRPLAEPLALEPDEPIIHLTVTGRCYARCQGCINRVFSQGDPAAEELARGLDSDPERDAALVLGLAELEAGEGLTVAFYGGEPFLAADKMDRLRRLLAASPLGRRLRLMVYTNGELLAQSLERFPELMRSIWLFSVSIDGDEAQHARFRPGTSLPRIVDNLKAVRSRCPGQVLFWSTLREGQSLLTCFEQFLELEKAGLVDHFFWHFAETSEPIQDFPAFASSYGRDLERLLEAYLARLRDGRLLPVAHLNELIIYLLSGRERGHTACAVELARNFDIVSGQVFACADLPHTEALGGLDEEGRLGLKEYDLAALADYKVDLGCFDCGVHFYCGGRCPVQALVGSAERTLQYCQLMRLHVGLVKERLPEIRAGLNRLGLGLDHVHQASAFLARYTDVVP